MKFKSKPIEINAVQFRRDNIEEVKEFIKNGTVEIKIEKRLSGKAFCLIKTMAEQYIVPERYYILSLFDSGFYETIEPDIFENDYEPA